MEERRKSKRLPLKLELKISSLFKQEYELITDINESISVKDISKTGVGFISQHELPVGYYFDAKVQLTPDKYFYAVLKILRVDKVDEGYSVGCEFVGLADILSMRVDMYGNELEESEE